MKITNIAVSLFVGLSAAVALAQTSPPATPPVPPSVPTTPPTSPSPPAAPAPLSQPTVAEGTLVRSQRLKNDNGTNSFVCSYRVGGTKRDVQLDESCPETMVFQLKR